MRAIDISNFTDLGASVVQGLKQENVTRVILGLHDLAKTEHQLRLLNNQFEIHFFAFFDASKLDADTGRVKQFINYCRVEKIAEPDKLWIDIEDNEYIQVVNQEQLHYVINSFVGIIHTGIYTSLSQWTKHINSTEFMDMPLWDASYNDGYPKRLDLLNHYGGWGRSEMKQHTANTFVGGVYCDDNYYEELNTQHLGFEETHLVTNSEIIQALQDINERVFQMKWTKLSNGYRLEKLF